jgi:tetratricopeptide (TPR) repeat protein
MRKLHAKCVSASESGGEYFQVLFEGEAACRMAAKEQATTSGNGLRVLAKILAWQGTFDQLLVRVELASQLLRQSLTLLEGPELADRDVRLEQAFVLWRMGAMSCESDREKAKRLFEQSLALYRALGDRWGMANALEDLGNVTRQLGTYGEAKQLGEESLAIRQALGDRRGIADSLWLLSHTAVDQGQLEEGERLARENSEIRQEIGDRAIIASGLGILGTPFIRRGKFDEAHTLCQESLAIYYDLGDRSALAWSNLQLGHIKTHLGQYDQARAQLRLSLALSQEIGIRRVEGFSLHWLGCVALAGEKYVEAQQLLQKSVTVYQEISQREDLGWALAGLGIAAHRLGKLRQAEEHLYQALRTAIEIRAFLPLMFALPATALLLADRGEKERAMELYALASRYPYVANSRWFEDVAGKYIAAIAVTLPPDVVTAAQERGKARDLWETAAELLDELAPEHDSEGEDSTTHP